MDAALKAQLGKVMARAAKSLGKSLRKLGGLNGRGRAGESLEKAPHERNTVVHLAAAFLCHDYVVYAEAGVPKRRTSRPRATPRLDLLAAHSDGTVVFAIEAKTFGDLRYDAVLRDARRLLDFAPQTDGPSAEFWEGAHRARRYGVVAITSFKGVTDVWNTQRDARAFRNVRNRELGASDARAASKLAAFLNKHRAIVGFSQVLSDARPFGPNRLAPDLLWAAFPLKPLKPLKRAARKGRRRAGS